jgi:hypothetical protein
MVLHDLLTNRQTDTGSGILPPRVQALKDGEDPLVICRRDPNAVVAHCKSPLPSPGFRPDVDIWRLLATKLDGVTEEILEQLGRLQTVCHDAGQASGVTTAPHSMMATSKLARTSIKTAEQSSRSKRRPWESTRE